MKIRKFQLKIITAMVVLTIVLSWFYYIHEKLSKPLRAATALIETPVAIASGISHYLKIGVNVYETPAAIILVNFIISVVLILLVSKLIAKRKIKTN